MNLREELIAELVKEKIPSPRLETDIILRYAAPDYPEITESQKEKALQMLNRRLHHEPLDKIIGKREFYKFIFEVNSDVLSPRPDTEILVERALALIPKEKKLEILDLGTGSGCILLSLLAERPQCRGVGVDVSQKALEIAKQNAESLKLSEKVTFINKSWTEPNFINEQFDIIVSNPPYIPTEDIAGLEEEVKNYDPLLALDGGVDGLDCYRQIAQTVPLILKNDGYILLEVGYNQAEAVIKIFKEQGLKFEEKAADLAGINRCIILKK